jgi:hypothetical protein
MAGSTLRKPATGPSQVAAANSGNDQPSGIAKGFPAEPAFSV